MDGVAAPQQQVPAPLPPVQPAADPPKQKPVPADGLHKMTLTLRSIGTLLYIVFIGWELFLLAFLPSPTGQLRELQSFGTLTSWVGAAGILGLGWLAVLRISQSKVSLAARQRSLIISAAILVPGIALAAVTPFFISREPSLSIDIQNPTRSEDFVAPVSVTFSLERAVSTLRNLGYRPTKFQWDVNGDSKLDEESVVPTFTAVYPKQGAYLVTVIIVSDGTTPRRLQRRIIIPRSVFSMAPVQPVVEKPVQFSVAGLVTDPKSIKQVTWDYGDGSKAEVARIPEAAHTYYVVGTYEVKATIQLTTNVEQTIARTIEVKEPVPLPFPITLTAQPQNLMGPAPFGALFSVESSEDLREISWDFGDGKEERGADLLRTGHTFEAVGIYPVVMRARNGSGQLAEITQIVRVTEPLQLSDLKFEGSPPVQNNRIRGEVPLEVELTPKTATPLVTFLWESTDEGTRVEDSTFRGTYREEGTYTVTLVAQNADGHVYRQPITIEVQPASAEPIINAVPENGVAPLTVQFDASESFIPPTETLAGFRWLFGDERNNDQAELASARVQHVYKTPGEYKVQVTLVTVSGKEFEADRTIVVRRPPLDACITSSRVRVQAGKGVEFDSDCSTGVPQTYVWEIRNDASPSVVLAQSPAAKYVHVFEAPGTYTVSLTLKDQWNNQDSSSVSITVTTEP